MKNVLNNSILKLVAKNFSLTHSKYRKYGSRLKIITDDENDKDIINIS